MIVSRRLLVLIAAVLIGCAAPGADDRALFHLFWVEPGDLMARTHVPDGLGIAAPPQLIMTLSTSPERAPRESAFRLTPTSEADHYVLAARDHRRFRRFQDRVVASIAPSASIAVRIDIAYCADTSRSPGSGPPVVEVVDLSDGTVMMTRPAATTAHTLQPQLPPC